MSELGDRLAEVDARIAEAARAAGRDPGGITRVVVTKFQPVSLVEELAALGVRDVGESRHQEASDKAEQLRGLGLRWHFVGQLQSNKARRVARYARVLHSVDRDALVDALADPDRGESDGAEAVAPGPVDAFLQLDLSGEPGRGGIAPEAAPALAERIVAVPGLRLIGVMAVAPLGADPARAFADAREHAERLREVAPEATALSMGMSADFEAAIREGATHLRIGTAITGNRPAPR